MEFHGVRSFARKYHLESQLDPEGKPMPFPVSAKPVVFRFRFLLTLNDMPVRRRIRASPYALHGIQFFLLQLTPPLQPRLSFSFE